MGGGWGASEENERKHWLSWLKSLERQQGKVFGLKLKSDRRSLRTPTTNHWKVIFYTLALGRAMCFGSLEKERMSGEFLFHLCFTSKTKDGRGSVQGRTQETRHLFTKFPCGLWYKALEVSQSRSQVCTALGKLRVFTGSGCHAHVRHLSDMDTWSKWVSDYRRKSNIYQNASFIQGFKTGQSDGKSRVLAVIARHWGPSGNVIPVQYEVLLLFSLRAHETTDLREEWHCIFSFY